MTSAVGSQIPFFGMEHASDLLKKLEWEFEQLQAAPNNKFAAFNFFVTAEHLLDWVHPGRSGNPQRKDRCTRHPLLAIVSHLCNRAKHLKLEDTRHASVLRAEVGRAPPRVTYVGGNVHSWGPAPVTLWIYVASDLQDQFGDRITPIDLAERTLDYWRMQPEVL